VASWILAWTSLALGACQPTIAPSPGAPSGGDTPTAMPGDGGATAGYPGTDAAYPDPAQAAASSFDGKRLALPRVDGQSPMEGLPPPATDAPPLAAAPTEAAAVTFPPPEAGATCRGIVVREGDRLVLDGQPVVFFGINVHYLLDPEFPEDRVEPIIQALSERGVNTARVWFFRKHDPERFARLLDIGARRGVRFVVTMEDNVFRGVDWFFGNEDEKKYRPHVDQTVSRFKDRPEVLLWEPINEPNCGDGRYDDECLKRIRDWVKMMARRVKALDPCHAVSSGMIGDGNFQSEQSNYRNIHGADAVEIASVHKRSVDDRDDEIEVAQDKDRPIFYGEIYDEAYDDGCQPRDGDDSPRARAERIKDDLRRAVEDGVDGYLLWDFSAGLVTPTGGGDPKDYCSKFGYDLADPLWSKLRESGDLPPPVPWR